MTRTLGVVMDPISNINVKKDTTLALLLAAQNRGWQLMYMEQSDLALENSAPVATLRSLQVRDDVENWYTAGRASASIAIRARCTVNAQRPAIRQ